MNGGLKVIFIFLFIWRAKKEKEETENEKGDESEVDEVIFL